MDRDIPSMKQPIASHKPSGGGPTWAIFRWNGGLRAVRESSYHAGYDVSYKVETTHTLKLKCNNVPQGMKRIKNMIDEVESELSALN